MKIPLYLSLTAAEFHACQKLPSHIAWMACHFSPYSTGLTNLPGQLPEGSLLILNDRTPVHNHDPGQICDALLHIVRRFSCRGILLDLQRPNCSQTAAIAVEATNLPCPVILSEHYAQNLSCPVFLSPPPLHIPLKQHLAPWHGREIWLEAALDSAAMTVTQTGSRYEPYPYDTQAEYPFCDEDLHCHYRIDRSADQVQFLLRRDPIDIDALLTEAETLGVTGAVGLWQELG